MLLRTLAVALAASTPLFWQAGQTDVEVPVPVVIPDETEQILRAYDNALFGLRFQEALAAARKLRPDNPQGQALVSAMEASALLGLKRDREAQELSIKTEQLAPEDPDPPRALFAGGLITKRFDVSADALDKMIARFPDAVRDLPDQWISAFLRNEPKGEDRRNEDRRVQLARIGLGGDLKGDYLAANAVRILVDRGDLSGADELLRYIDEPLLIENMLVQRRYSKLWPRLEQIAGPHLSKVRESALGSVERAYLAAPDSTENLQGYVDALRHAGRLDDAIALKSKLPATREAMAKADETTGWVVNSIAYALYDAGRDDEGDQLFAMLNEPPRNDAGWRVSMIINRLEMLVLKGKFDKAATLLDAAELSAKNDGNAYSQQLVRRLRYCTTSALGKRDEAAKLLPGLMGHADDALDPTVGGLLCAGEIDKAEQLVLKGLNVEDKDKREKFEADFVRELQPVLLTEDDPSVWQGRWSELRKRPAMSAAYDRLGRDMPTEMLPPSKAVPPTK